MATENKKAVRNRVTQLKDTPTEVLLEKFASSMTDTDYAAIVKILKSRKVEIPAEHGPVTEDEEANVQRVIQIEELSRAEIGLEKRKPGMGALEWTSVIVGMVSTIFLWQRSTLVSVLFGLGMALLVYTIGAFGRKFWREMGTKRGTFDVPENTRRRR
ncbi:MAG: hypothetical protein Q4E62_05590 [Sutterellaceae bacterium]|nr:hypothetical protein [Sutterellaceae bacterium]